MNEAPFGLEGEFAGLYAVSRKRVEEAFDWIKTVGLLTGRQLSIVHNFAP